MVVQVCAVAAAYGAVARARRLHASSARIAVAAPRLSVGQTGRVARVVDGASGSGSVARVARTLQHRRVVVPQERGVEEVECAAVYTSLEVWQCG